MPNISLEKKNKLICLVHDRALSSVIYGDCNQVIVEFRCGFICEILSNHQNNEQMVVERDSISGNRSIDFCIGNINLPCIWECAIHFYLAHMRVHLKVCVSTQFYIDIVMQYYCTRSRSSFLNKFFFYSIFHSLSREL